MAWRQVIVSEVKCPSCDGALKRVYHSSDSYLNRDQFDSIRAGDYYCETCPEEKGTAKQSHTGFAYFWAKDVIKDVVKSDAHIKCKRCLGIRIRKGIYSGICSLCFDRRMAEAKAEGVDEHKGVLVRKMTDKERYSLAGSICDNKLLK